MPFTRARISLRLAAGVVLAGLAAGISVAQTAPTDLGGACESARSSIVLDVNSIAVEMAGGAGLLAQSEDEGVIHGSTGSPASSLGRLGLVVGGMQDGELRVSTLGTSETDFQPGPIAGGCGPEPRIWSVSTEDLDLAVAAGRISDAVRNWPWQLGAPVIDGDGIPGNYAPEAGDLPRLLGDGMAWWIVSDAGVHRQTGGTGLGVEIRISAFAVHRFTRLRNVVFLKLDILFAGGSPIQEAYFGVDVEPRIGFPGDDFVGSDSLLSMGYAYNRDDMDEGGYGEAPPAVGVLMLDPAAADTRLMDSFVRYAPGQDDNGLQGLPRTESDFYNYVQANWKDGGPILDWDVCENQGRSIFIPVQYMFPGRPENDEFWSEVNCDGQGTPSTFELAGSRFLMGTGPFGLQPGETKSLLLAVVWDRGRDNLDSVARMRERARGVKEGAASLMQPIHSPPEPAPSAAVDLGLTDIYPNPASSRAQFRLSVPQTTRVDVEILDMLGRPVADVFSGRPLPGVHVIELPLTGIASGTYIVRTRVGSAVASSLLVVMR